MNRNGSQKHNVSEGVELFLHHLTDERRAASNTVSAYHNDLAQFREYLESSDAAHPNGTDQDGDSMEAVDSSVVAGFVLNLREKGYSQASVARKVAAVKSFFRYAAETGLVGRNPAMSLGSPQVRRAEPRAVSAADVEALLNGVVPGEQPDDLRNRAMIAMLYHTGMRVSEVVALDLQDLDLAEATVRCRGRNGRLRQLPLAQGARSPLDVYLSSGRPHLVRENHGSNGGGTAHESADHPDNEALFLNHRGTRLTRQGFWLIMKERARRAGIQAEITPHSLRHSFALHQVRKGTALRALKELLGHVNISTTQIYSHALGRGASHREGRLTNLA
jgi:integrase/recombinase XerD